MTSTPDTTETKFRIRNLYKVFGPKPDFALRELLDNDCSKTELLEKHNHALALKNINLDAKAGEITVIMGLSGSGKSTLIRHVNRLIEPTCGEIFFEGTDILRVSGDQLRAIRREKKSMVFQNFGLLPHRTVIENAGLALEARGISRREIFSEAEGWLDEVGLKGYGDKYPNQLSGGMRQRVGIARALTSNAEVMLMDEAFSALDPLIRTDMQDLLLKLQKELRKTILFITHDLDEALRLGDQIAILRDGAIIQKGDPQDIILNPADNYVADFTKNINRGRVLRVGSVMVNEKQEHGAKIDRETTLEDALKIFSENDTTTAIVTYNSEPVGSINLNSIKIFIACRNFID